MARYEGTVAVTGQITPIDTADVYPLIDSDHIKGGIRQVATREDLNKIPTAHLKNGMFGYVNDEKKLYVYFLTQWELFKADVDLSAISSEITTAIDLDKLVSKEGTNNISVKDDGLYSSGVSLEDLVEIDLSNLPSKDELQNFSQTIEIEQLVKKTELTEIDLSSLPSKEELEAFKDISNVEAFLKKADLTEFEYDAFVLKSDVIMDSGQYIGLQPTAVNLTNKLETTPAQSKGEIIMVRWGRVVQISFLGVNFASYGTFTAGYKFPLPAGGISIYCYTQTSTTNSGSFSVANDGTMSIYCYSTSYNMTGTLTYITSE